MDNARFILCRKCDALHHITRFDSAAPTDYISPGEAREIPEDDRRAFMHRHAGHKLEALKAVGDYYIPQGVVADPMAVAYLKVTNGKREFLLRRSRGDILEPRKFERIDGNLSESPTASRIQERELRRELRLRFRWDDGESLTDGEIERFIALFRAVAGDVPARSGSATQPSFDDDNIKFAALEAATKMLLLERCTSYFSTAEVQALRRFIEAHSNGSDVMTVVLRRQITVAALV
jgi:hypothetical protein